MEFRIYLRMLQRGWWLIALSTLAALTISLALLYVKLPMYRTSARFIVSPTGSLTYERDVIYSLDTLDQRSIVSTYAEVLNSDRIQLEVSAALQIPREELAHYKFSAVVLPDANILELSVEGPNPEVAAMLANGVGQQSIDYIQALYKKIYDINFLDPAEPPGEPFSPQPSRDVGLAVALGMMLGAGLAILREYISTPLEALRQRNMLDPVSQAFTRRYFQRRLDEELTRQGSGGVSMGLVQLDGLKDLIDTLPQTVVQKLMRQVMDTLRRELRGSDMVGRWNDICFAVMLPATPGLAASRTFERIRRALAEPLILDKVDEPLRLEPHVGVAERVGDEPTSVLLTRAEEALERARYNDNKTMLFSVDMGVERVAKVS